MTQSSNRSTTRTYFSAQSNKHGWTIKSRKTSTFRCAFTLIVSCQAYGSPRMILNGMVIPMAVRVANIPRWVSSTTLTPTTGIPVAAVFTR